MATPTTTIKSNPMMEALLTIIALLLVVLATVVYQLIIELKRLPTSILRTISISFEKKVDRITKEIEKIKSDLELD